MSLSTIDVVVVVFYAIGIFSLAQYVSREKAGHQKDTSDYFLASKNLPWWAIGASLIAANISAEQIVGMSGSGYAIGLAIASYEWMAALTLLMSGRGFASGFSMVAAESARGTIRSTDVKGRTEIPERHRRRGSRIASGCSQAAKCPPLLCFL